ncbi:MAG: mevalonate kinase [Myxococcota bacterium]|nr:mevalonate kinase [Myxococcota bacterium]
MSSPRLGSGRACGKAILLGEHSVVYGGPAVAIPVPALTVDVEIEAGDGWDLGPAEGVDRRILDRARDAQLAAIGWSGNPPRIRVRANLPPACGLGSSAALSVALARALSTATGRPTDPEAVGTLANHSELVFHDRPSGVDVATVLAGTPIHFRRGQAPRPLQVACKIDLWVVDTGVRSCTAEVVAAVARRREADHETIAAAMQGLDQAARRGMAALETGAPAELISAVDDAMTGLRAIGVSHPAIERVVAAAREAGAPAAKLSGAGCGGIVLVVAPEPDWEPGPALADQLVLTRISLG